MKIELHDDTPARPGEKHGPGGPTHCANLQRPEYEYQLEQHLIDIVTDWPEVVRVWDPLTGREWLKSDGAFVETRRNDGPKDDVWTGLAMAVRVIEGSGPVCVRIEAPSTVIAEMLKQVPAKDRPADGMGFRLAIMSGAGLVELVEDNSLGLRCVRYHMSDGTTRVERLGTKS